MEVSPAVPTPTDDSVERWGKIIDAAEAKAQKDRTDWDKYVKLFKDGQFPAEGDNGPGASVNETFAYVLMLMASLHSNAPAIEVEPREGGDASAFGPAAQYFQMPPEEIRRTFADTVETFEQYSYEETGSDDTNTVGLFEALVRGEGCVKTGFDPVRQVAVIDSLRRDEVYVDPHARYSLAQADYVIHTVTKKYDAARDFFKEQGVNIGEPNWNLVEGTGHSADMQRLNKPSDKDQFKFYEIWCRKPDGGRHIYYKAYKGQSWLHQRDWPFVLDSDDFPFCFLRFNTQFTQMGDGFTELSVVDGLRRMVEETTEYFRRYTQRARAKKVLLDEAVFDEDMQDRLLSGRDMECIRIAKGGKAWDELVHVVDFHSPHDPSPDVAEFFRERKDAILGMDEMLRGAAQKKLTATQADIVDEYGKLRMGRRQKILDGFLTKQTRQRAQIDRQLVPPEKIAKLAGIRPAQIWQAYAGQADDFVSEYSIGIAAGSTGERAKREKIQRLTEHLKMCMELNSRRMQMGAPPSWDEDQISLEIARTNNIRRPERFKLAPPPPPQMMPPGMPGHPGQAVPPGAGAPAGNPASVPAPAPTNANPQQAQMQQQMPPQPMPQGVPA